MKIKLRYIGKHMEKGVYEIEESKASELLALDTWEKADKKIILLKEKDLKGLKK